MKRWKLPPIMKVYEALGVLADGRISGFGSEALVVSSRKNKTYQVLYDAKARTIVASDSGSFWQRYLSYPSIAMLLYNHTIEYDAKLAADLKGIVWKDMADKNKHDYTKMEAETLTYSKHPAELRAECQRILREVMALKLMLPEKLLRPEK